MLPFIEWKTEPPIEPIAKAPPMSSRIRQGQGSLSEEEPPIVLVLVVCWEGEGVRSSVEGEEVEVKVWRQRCGGVLSDETWLKGLGKERVWGVGYEVGWIGSVLLVE
jgi:hypothetical protein